LTILVLCAAVLAVFLLMRLLLASGKASKTSDTGADVAQTDAEHFATLLVTEISTYNTEKVREARRSRNILSALHNEIHQAERMYQQRYGVPGSGDRDYFREALIRILANGDRRALGRPE
jgi:hypothetical protein